MIITISSNVLNNWRYGGTTAKLRIFSNARLTTSDNQIIMQSSPSNASWYKEITCTVSGTNLTIPSFTIDSTTDSSIPNGTYVAYFFDQQNGRRDNYIGDFRVPHTLGTTLNWGQILNYTKTAPRAPDPTFYNADQTNAQILAILTDFANDNSLIAGNDTRLEKDLSQFGNSLSNAVSSIGATSTVLNITRPVTVSANLAIPSNIKLNITGEGFVTVAANQTLTINSFASPGNRRVFNTTASGAKVLFAKGAVNAMNIAWWTGTADGTDVTDAVSEALQSTYQNAGGVIEFPEGRFVTSGGFILSDATTITGQGNFVLNGYGGTSLKLVSPSTTYLFKIGEGEFGVRLQNILLDGTGTANTDGLLLEGTSPNTSGDLSITHVTFQSFKNGINYHSLGGSWQFAQIKIDQSIFQGNSVGIKTNSLNSEWALESVNFAIPANGIGFDTAGIGIINIKNSEFAGPGAGQSAKIMQISGAHVQINFIGCQDEGLDIWFQNDVSDISGIVNLFGNLVQSKIVINQSMTFTSIGNNYVPRAIRITGSAVPRIISQNDHLRTTENDFEGNPVSPMRLFDSTDSPVQIENNASLPQFTTRYPQRFVSPNYFDGNPTVPVVGVGHKTSVSESKILLRLGRLTSSETFDYYYDFWRANSGNDAGRLIIQGNQTNFTGYDLRGGDLYVNGAVRNQTNALADGATITVDPRTANYQYVTLGGNRTLSVGTMSSFEKTRADGQRLYIEIKQDATGSRTLTLSTGAGQFAFGTDIASITLTTGANKTDILTAQYSARADRWFVIDFKKGF